MRAILTGMNGTVAPAVAKTLKREGYDVIQYDRNKVSTEDEAAIRMFIREVNPDLLMHFAMGETEWTRMLASITSELDIQYVYISSVSVYDPAQHPKPFRKSLEPVPNDDYGTYKFKGEKASKAANKNAYIARLSWQIGHKRGSNTMIDQLYRQMDEKGVIEASSNFYPSAAFLEDTAKSLVEMLGKKPDIYHLNTNQSLSFFDIVTRLKTLHPSLVVRKTEVPDIDVRMIDEALNMPSLEDTIEANRQSNQE